MPYLAIADWRFGLDRRRPQATGVPGTLWDAKNCFISRGGDIVRAKKFVLLDELDDGTDRSIGLASIGRNLYSFYADHTSAPTTIPPPRYSSVYGGSGFPDNGPDPTRLLDATSFDGLPYAIVEYDDGSIRHFYNGSEVTHWGTLADAAASFELVAAVLAAKINANEDVTAEANGAIITITAAVPGVTFVLGSSTDDPTTDSTPQIATAQRQANVAAVAEVRGAGSITITGGTSLSGTNRITVATVNGVNLLDTAVDWILSNASTANALVVSINALTATHGYTAEAAGAVVTLTAAAGTGATKNGHVVAVTTTGDVTVSTQNVAGGVTEVEAVARVVDVTIGTGTFDAEDSWMVSIDGTEYWCVGRAAGMGRSIFAYKKRLWSTAGSLLRYCVLNDPEDWTTTTDPASDAGFINISTDTGGSLPLVGVEKYVGDVAIFGEDNIAIYTLNADAEENTYVSALDNTGALSRRSILAYGSSDVYYLDKTGIRSIRSRDGYNAAYVNDVGSAIDTFVVEWMASVGEDAVSKAAAVYDSVDGRYWLAIGSRIFALSYYPGSKITAWTYLDLGFDVDDIVRVGQKIYVRSGDNLYLYGGLDGATYPDDDEFNVVVETPFMSANDPAAQKMLEGFDAAVENDWLVEILVDPNDTTKTVTLGTLGEVSYGDGRQGLVGRAALIAFRFTCSRQGYASLSNSAIHYDKEKAE